MAIVCALNLKKGWPDVNVVVVRDGSLLSRKRVLKRGSEGRKGENGR